MGGFSGNSPRAQSYALAFISFRSFSRGNLEKLINIDPAALVWIVRAQRRLEYPMYKNPRAEHHP